MLSYPPIFIHNIFSPCFGVPVRYGCSSFPSDIIRSAFRHARLLLYTHWSSPLYSTSVVMYIFRNLHYFPVAIVTSDYSHARLQIQLTFLILSRTVFTYLLVFTLAHLPYTVI